MAFNYKLLGQVKQACIKLAAPVPPEEVTAPKPYVKPPELEPQQPNAADRVVVDPLTDEDISRKIREPLTELINSISDFRASRNIPSNADLSAYPKIQEEYKNSIAKKMKELIFQLPEKDLNSFKETFGGDSGVNYFLENAHIQPDFNPPIGQRGLTPRGAISRLNSYAINQHASNYFNNFKENVLSAAKYPYMEATPEDFGRIRGTALAAAKQIDPYSIGLNAARHFLNSSKTPTNVYENVTPTEYAARQRARIAQQNPVAQQKPVLPASRMYVGAPMLDRRFSRTDVNAAKPAAPVQQPAPKPATPDLPVVPTAKPVGGGRNY